MQGNILPLPISSCNSVAGNVEISSQKWSVGLDIVRTIACVSVIISHFFLYTKVNQVPFEGFEPSRAGSLILTVLLRMNKWAKILIGG